MLFFAAEFQETPSPARLDSRRKRHYRFQYRRKLHLADIDIRPLRKRHAQHAIVALAGTVGGYADHGTARAGRIDPFRPARTIQACRTVRRLSAFAVIRRASAETWRPFVIQDQRAAAPVGVCNSGNSAALESPVRVGDACADGGETRCQAADRP